ncbi:MAG: hypothetical protein LKE40_01905 [Spirochaetia bacterium]|nr:hypothetical protein [Spirochaetia bacterium]
MYNGINDDAPCYYYFNTATKNTTKTEYYTTLTYRLSDTDSDGNALSYNISGIVGKDTPSIALFYAIVPNNSDDNVDDVDTCISTFKSTFSTDFVRSNNGKNFSSSKFSPVLSIDNDTESIGLYGMTVASSTTTPEQQNSPAYTITAGGSLEDGTKFSTTFTLTKTDTDGVLSFELSQSDAQKDDVDYNSDGSLFTADPVYLYRTNGKNFSLSADYSDEDFNPAYILNDSSINDTSTYDLLIFMAFNLSPVDGAGFTNIVWSPLQLLADISFGD